MEDMKITNDKPKYTSLIFRAVVIGLLVYIAFTVKSIHYDVHEILHQKWHDDSVKQSSYDKQQELKTAILDKLLLQLSNVK
tara:strand:- start:2370 stop:2612 length:243 start_codon:yes stop_codon:yes gene_type:complete